MANTEVILIEPIAGLGAEADVVKVRSGYARNFLVPSGKAYPATPANLKRLNVLKARRAAREAQELNEAETLARRIAKAKLQMVLETGETGKAFGSITASDLAERLKGELGGMLLDHRKFEMPTGHAIKSTGDFEVGIKIHPDVTAKLSVTVKANTPPVEEAPVPAEAAPAKGKGRRTTAK